MYNNKHIKTNKNFSLKTNKKQNLISLFQNQKFCLAFIVSLVCIIFPADKITDELKKFADKYLYL